MKAIDIGLTGTFLPAPEGTCSKCAVEHEDEQPHNQQSLFWQYWFYRNSGGQWPTWSDAMEHCTDEVKGLWKKHLKKFGVKV